MYNVILVIYILITASLIGLVLIQRSEGGGLGMGSSGGMGSFLNPRGTANLLTRATATLAVLFMLTSGILAWMAAQDSDKSLAELAAEESAKEGQTTEIDVKAETETAPKTAPVTVPEAAPTPAPIPVQTPVQADKTAE